MKLLTTIALLVVSMLSTVAQAWVQPCLGSWDFRAEYLYFKPMISESKFAQTSSATTALPNGTLEQNDFSFKSAYRLYGAYAFGEHDVQLVWTHLPQISRTASLTGPLLSTAWIPIGNIFSLATSKADLRYFAVDGLIGFWGKQCDIWSYMLRTGLQYANFKFSQNYTYTGINPNDFVVVRSRTWGIGPEIAFETSYNLRFLQSQYLQSRGGRVALTGGFKGGLLAAQYDAHIMRNSAAGGGVMPSANEKRWDLVSMWDLRLGLSFEMPFRCFSTLLEVGYEMLSYRQVIDRIFFAAATSSGLSADVYSDANFQGPYIALDFMF